jgi:hypothetical protein
MATVQKNNRWQTVHVVRAVERALSVWVLLYQSTPTFGAPFQTTDVSTFTRPVPLRVRYSVALP